MKVHQFVDSGWWQSNLLDDTTTPVCRICSYTEADPRHTHHPEEPRLFNIQPYERYWLTLDSAIQEHIDEVIKPRLGNPPGTYTYGHVVVDEYSVVDNRTFLRSTDSWLDEIGYSAEDAEIDEFWHGQLLEALKLPEIVKAAEALLQTIAGHINYHMAESLVASHTVTFSYTPSGEILWEVE